MPVKKAKQKFTKNFSRHVDNLNDLVNIIKIELQKRFSISLISNCVKTLLSLISSILIARLLGPEDTGRYFFLFFHLLVFVH